MCMCVCKCTCVCVYSPAEALSSVSRSLDRISADAALSSLNICRALASRKDAAFASFRSLYYIVFQYFSFFSFWYYIIHITITIYNPHLCASFIRRNIACFDAACASAYPSFLASSLSLSIEPFASAIALLHTYTHTRIHTYIHTFNTRTSVVLYTYIHICCV